MPPFGGRGLRQNAWQLSSSSEGKPMDLAPDFNEFLELLNAHHVEYAIVGGWRSATSTFEERYTMAPQ
jgi:hypothetical protein